MLDKIGRYQLLKQVGQGAMGVVYKAMDPSIERVVAVKTMSADLDTDPDLRARFFREARSAGQLSHKNIVTIYDLGEESGKAYMAMEFLDGEDLKQIIARGARIPIEAKLDYMIEVMEGLAHAHKKGIFHRDIKPGNIYVTISGEVKILDFGLARMASSDMTKTGSLMGTPNYMSPEQINGAAVDHRTDIFSAGATFYELLTYRKPFYSTSLQATFFKILQEDPEPVENVIPNVPPEFSTVLLRALAKDPAARYQTADEMLAALERFPKILEPRRRKARMEARRAVEKLDSFVSQNQQILDEPSEELERLRERILTGVGANGNDETLKLETSDLGLLEVLDIRDRARREQERLELLLQKRQEAATLLTEALSLEAEGQLEKALDLVDRILTGLPDHVESGALSTRIRKTISDQDEAETRSAIEKLRRLIAENGESLQSEDHLNPGDLEAAISRGSFIVHSPEADATIFVGSPPRHSGVLQIRDNAIREHDRLEAIVTEKRSIRERAEEEKRRRIGEILEESQELRRRNMLPESLQRLKEVFALDPQNNEAQALQKQIDSEIEAERRRQEQIKKASDLFQHASLQHSNKDLDGARKSLLDALALHPNFAEAKNLLAEVEGAKRNEIEAKKRDAEAAAALARKLLREGGLRQARQQAEQALQIFPELGAAKEALNEISWAEERLPELLKQARSLLEKKDDQGAAARVAEIFKLQRDFGPALELKKNIDEIRAARELEAQRQRELIAKTLVEAGDALGKQLTGKARELIRTVLDQEPSHPEALKLLKQAEELEARQELEKRARKSLVVADEFAKREDFDGAVWQLENADKSIASLEIVKQSLERYRNAARIQREAREKAEREKRERIQKTLSDARTSQNSGNLEKARTLVKTLLEEDPAHSEARALLNSIDEAIRKRQQQEEIEKKARELISQAENLAAPGNYAAAITCLQKAEPAVAALNSVKQKLEDYRKSAEAQEKAAELARQLAIHMDLGKKAFAQGDYAACEREMDRVLALQSSHTGALETRGLAQAELQKQREAELKKEQDRQRRIQEALTNVRSSLDKGEVVLAGTFLDEAVQFGADSRETGPLRKKIEKQRRRLRKRPENVVASAGTATLPRTRMLQIGIGFVILVAAGWAFLSTRGPDYRQQIRSAQADLQQQDFDGAIKVLQQVPAGSPLYNQAQSLMTQAQDGQKKKNVESLAAQAVALRKDGKNDESLSTAQKVLDLDPSNADAKSVRDEIQAENYKAASASQQDQIVNEALAKAEELYNAGNYDGAKEKAEEVKRNRPGDPRTLKLEQRITAQIDARGKANTERLKLAQAKTSAQSAKAPDLAPASFAAAQGMEDAAVRQQGSNQFDQATKSFSEAARLYGVAENDARTAAQAAADRATAEQQRLTTQRNQAETSRGNYEQIRTKARDAGADTKAAVPYQAAIKVATDAQAKFDRNDFTGARGDFDTASKQMQQAVDTAAQVAARDAQAAADRDSAAKAAESTRAAAAQKAAAQKADDERTIQTLMDRYKAAYERKDLSAIRSIFPSLGGSEEAATNNNFNVARTIQLQLGVTGIQISGDTATVTSRYQIAIVTKDSQRQNSPQESVQFILRKVNGTWLIQSVAR